MEYIGKISTYFFGLVISILLGGLLVFKFWSWFIIPVFDVQPLIFGQAVGLSTVLSLFRLSVSTQKPDYGTAELMLSTILTELLLLGFGWVISWFI